MLRHYSLILLAGAALAACAPAAQDPVEPPAAALSMGEQALEDLRILAADEMQGRAVATEGNAMARDYLLGRYAEIGLSPVGGSFEHGFTYLPRADSEETVSGVNLVGLVEGTGESDLVMVVTAHYDHVGVREGEIYNGADDNASGTAGLLAAAKAFVDEPPVHDTLFVAFDAEENGLRGARAFVDSPPIPAERIAFNLNFDMLGYSEQDQLWAVGTHHYPALIPVVETVAAKAPVGLPMGFDEPSETPGADWTLLSDHGPFHMAGIPFIYLGVDYHPHYHQPTDTYENMTLDFFQNAVETSVMFAREADAQLEMIAAGVSRADREAAAE